jgi:heat shock protein HslJ
VVIVGVLALAVVACGSSSSKDQGSKDTGSSKPSNATALEDKQWTLSAAVDIGAPIEGVSVTAEFADGHLSGDSGCNAYNAPYRVTGAEMTIGPQIASTQMACGPKAGAVERAYLALLPKVTTFKIEDKLLTLLGNGTALAAYDEVDGATALEGKWTATGYYAGSAIQSPIIDSTLTAEFASGELTGDSGCNTFGGSYEVSGTAITIGALRSTLRACEQTDLQTQEQQYQAALQLATSFSVAGDRLDLFRADGGFAATFLQDPTG